MLDDFSKPRPGVQADDSTQQAPSSVSNDADESAFLRQLEQDMANMMSEAAQESGAPDSTAFESTVDQGAEAFSKKLDESGIQPGDFFKQLMNDVLPEENANTKPPTAEGAGGEGAGQGGDSFNDAIQRTINRMKESGDKATAAATEDDKSDDLLAQLLKAVETGENDDSDLTKLISGMMEQLSNKEMLYEPMKDLQTKFGPWIDTNKDKISQADLSRYQTQADYVAQIVAKFEEPGYSDEDQKCREYIWERMQSVCHLFFHFFFCLPLTVESPIDASRRQSTGRAGLESVESNARRCIIWERSRPRRRNARLSTAIDWEKRTIM